MRSRRSEPNVLEGHQLFVAPAALAGMNLVASSPDGGNAKHLEKYERSHGGGHMIVAGVARPLAIEVSHGRTDAGDHSDADELVFLELEDEVSHLVFVFLREQHVQEDKSQDRRRGVQPRDERRNGKGLAHQLPGVGIGWTERVQDVGTEPDPRLRLSLAVLPERRCRAWPVACATCHGRGVGRTAEHLVMCDGPSDARRRSLR
mmetsp:Transcript_49728/g.146669  ORF Transcript_49728/g.146669 Transcript_49728/m.146669 type:complete len:204 (+) Transcript_49728:739-1350(+)